MASVFVQTIYHGGPMPFPWEKGGEAWKNIDQPRSTLITGKRYSFYYEQETEALEVSSFEKGKPIFNLDEGAQIKTFMAGILLGRVEDCDWLPYQVKEFVESFSDPMLCFVGSPADGEGCYFFCIEQTDNNNSQEMELDE